MSSNTNQASSGSQRIDLGDPRSLERWTKELSVTEAQLREAVTTVGDSAPDVEMHLKGSRASTNEDVADLANDAPRAP